MNNLIRLSGVLACAAAVAFFAPAPASAQVVQDKGDVVSGPVAPVAIFVSKLTGRAQFRISETAPWQPARAGARLASGCTIRTGPASALELVIGASQVITLDRLTTVTLSQAFMDGQTSRTRAELDVGRVKFDVNSHGFSNDLKIRTPDAVLAVKGTSGGVEFVGGVGTTAFGALTNTGTFVLTYEDGSVATVTDDHETSSQIPNPAANEAAEAEVVTTEPRSREPDEAEQVSRSTGDGEVFLITTGVVSKPKPDQIEPDQVRDDVDPDEIPVDTGGGDGGGGDGGGDGGGGTEPPPIGPEVGSIFIDEVASALRRVLSDGSIQDLAPVAGINPAAAGGLAVRKNPANSQPQLIRLESVLDSGLVRNVIRGVDLNDDGEPAGPFGVLSDRTDVQGFLPRLRGLAGLGGEIYAVGDDTLDHAVYRVDLNTGGLTKVMVPGIELQGGAAEAAERGTIFIAGLEAGVPFPAGASFGNLVILEVDPRINYLADARSGLNNEFAPSGETANPDNVSLASLGQVTGMGFVGDPDSMGGEGTLTLSAESPGGAVFVQYAPEGKNLPGDPRLVRIDAAPSISINGLSRDFVTDAAPSFTLANPPGAIDVTTLNSFFSNMGYSRRALDSGVVERSLRTEILKVARDPANCQASGALDTLHSMLEQHIDQTAGIGRTVADFRASIFADHPCQPPPGG